MFTVSLDIIYLTDFVDGISVHENVSMVLLITRIIILNNGGIMTHSKRTTMY